MTSLLLDKPSLWAATAAFAFIASACGSDAEDPQPVDPDTAAEVAIDRFSAEAGTIMVRDAIPGLPGPDEPIDFDQPPFITQGLGPDGQTVRYYDFDIQPQTPAPIFVFFREGEDTPVEGQLNVVDVVPGDAGYNDFWQVTRVTVPADYVANTATSLADIADAGFGVETTDQLVNCPVVPKGSTARLRFRPEESNELTRGWYKGQVVYYFSFEEAPLQVAGGAVPVSPIFVTFNVNPGEPDGGPISGFMTEPDSSQTHNVVATVPGDPDYSPLWLATVYDNAAFDGVSDLESAAAAPSLLNPGSVNCPVVEVE